MNMEDAMKTILAAFTVLTLSGSGYAQFLPPFIDIERGDANGDGNVNLFDCQFLGGYLFQGGNEPPCLNAADANDDERLNLSDIVYLNNFLFMGGTPPPPPFPGCGPDPTSGSLSCENPVCQ
jgi:hypothetical protein